jgi:hypothetical protein
VRVAVAVLLWVVTIVRLPTLLRDRRQRALWCSLFALTLLKTDVAAPMGSPIVPHVLGVLAAFFLLRFVTLVTGARGLRRQAAFTAVMVAALVALAAAAGGIDTSAEVLEARLPGAAVAYWVVLEAYLGMVLIVATVLFWTVARGAPAGPPRWGLRAMAAGSLLVAVYAAVRAALIVAHGTGVPVGFGALAPAGQIVQVTGLLLTVGGGLVSAGRRTRAIAAATRDLIVLRPLWTAMRDAFPEVILFSPRRAVIELAGVDDVRLRRYRRVIEIRDGMLALRDHLPPAPPEVGTTPPGPADPGAGTGPEAGAGAGPGTGTGPGTPKAALDPAVAEAEAIVAALRRRAAGEAPLARTGQWTAVGATEQEEIVWLCRVSRAYRRARRGRVSAAPAPTPTPLGSAR